MPSNAQIWGPDMKGGQVRGSGGTSMGFFAIAAKHHRRPCVSSRAAGMRGMLSGSHCARSCSGLGGGSDNRSASARSSLPGSGSPSTAAVTTSGVGMLDRFN